MSFLILIALIVIIWLLWTLCRNSGDALDKQTALQYEIVALEKRIEQLVERFPAPNVENRTEKSTEKSTAKSNDKPKPAARRSPAQKTTEAKKPAAAKSDETPTPGE